MGVSPGTIVLAHDTGWYKSQPVVPLPLRIGAALHVLASCTCFSSTGMAFFFRDHGPHFGETSQPDNTIITAHVC